MNWRDNRHPTVITHSNGEKISSGTGRRRKFNPASVVNFETERAGTKMLFPPTRGEVMKIAHARAWQCCRIVVGF